MGKSLSEMTLEELRQLFPIYLTAPNPEWASRYTKMESLLRSLWPDMPLIQIEHIGSTAIRGIWAKDIVDILAEFDVATDLRVPASIACENGFRVLYTESGRISLKKGYSESGFEDEVYHLHLRLRGDHDELYFRDLMNAEPDYAKAYEQLKLDLWKRYPHNRNAYTEAKTDFIRKHTEIAKERYPGRYE